MINAITMSLGWFIVLIATNFCTVALVTAIVAIIIAAHKERKLKKLCEDHPQARKCPDFIETNGECNFRG